MKLINGSILFSILFLFACGSAEDSNHNDDSEESVTNDDEIELEEEVEVFQFTDVSVEFTQIDAPSNFEGKAVSINNSESDAIQGRDDVERDGETLLFTLTDGSEGNISNYPLDQDAPNRQIYTFHGDVEGLNYWLLKGVQADEEFVMLINKNNGMPYESIGIPIASSGGKYAVSASTNKFELFEIVEDGLLMDVGEVELENWNISSIQWTDDNTFIAVCKDGTYRQGEIK